ncbi:MAG: R3H domain-containing nucleic acid-binding protein [Patescibacteria group bacterium]
MDEIKKEVENFLEKMTFPSEVLVSEDSKEGFKISIHTNDGGLLIGFGGETITSIIALVKKIVQKKFPDAPRFFLDINDYRQRKRELLMEDAKNFAKQVRLYRKEVVLHPMSSFERRIIHTVLSEYPDIITESIGIDPERRIVIRLYQ